MTVLKLIMILGHGSELEDELRVDAAVEYGSTLKNKGYEVLYLASGGIPNNFHISIGERMRELLIEYGISADSIITEHKAMSTRQNFRLGKKLLEDVLEEIDEVMVVTSSYHLARSKMLAKEYFKNVKISFGIANTNYSFLKLTKIIFTEGKLIRSEFAKFLKDIVLRFCKINYNQEIYKKTIGKIPFLKDKINY